MKLGAVVVAVWLLALARAVLIEDAFNKDWIHYSYGALSHAQLLDESSLIGLSNKNFLYTVDMKSGRVKSFIDLSIHGSSDFALLDDVIVTYSLTSPQMSLFEKSGVFIGATNLTSVPTVIRQISSNGVAVLQSNGDLVLWQGKQVVHLGTYKQKDFAHFCTSDKEFIVIGSQGIEIIHGTDLTHELVSPEYWNHYLIDKKNPQSYIGNLKEFSVQTGGSSIVLAKTTGGETTESYKKIFSSISDVKVSESAVAVVSEGKVALIKFDKFLETRSKSSVKTETFNLNASGSVYLSENVLATLVNHGDSARVETINHESGARNTYIVDLNSSSSSGKSILVDKPESLSKIDIVSHLAEETKSASMLLHWLLRYKNHLVSLGKFLSTFRFSTYSSLQAEGDEYGFGKILLSFDNNKRILVATDSTDGVTLWEQPVNFSGKFIGLTATGNNVYFTSQYSVVVTDLRTGHINSTESFGTPIDKLFEIDSVSDNTKIIALQIGGSIVTMPQNAQLPSSQFFFESSESGVSSFKSIENKLVKTWGLEFPDETVIKVTKNKDSLSVAAGISRSDRSVLYKYLNPNVVCVVSKTNKKLILRIIDGVTGEIIHKQHHENENIDPSSLKVEQNDNWIVYSYLSTFPRIEQRIVVIDMFQDKKPETEESPFISKNVTVSSKAFIFPEKIEALSSTATKFGITVKSLIALTETGSLIEIPKFVLNSRRIDDRKMTPADFADDFRLSPYEPIIPPNYHSVLNHKNKILISKAGQDILVLPTELESTAVVCVVNNLNEFCTLAQPSSSYDLLSTSFDKIKLIFTITFLMVTYVALKPLVHSKKLNAKWIV